MHRDWGHRQSLQDHRSATFPLLAYSSAFQSRESLSRDLSFYCKNARATRQNPLLLQLAQRQSSTSFLPPSHSSYQSTESHSHDDHGSADTFFLPIQIRENSPPPPQTPL